MCGMFTYAAGLLAQNMFMSDNVVVVPDCDCLTIFELLDNLPYSHKILLGIKFGGLAVCPYTAKFKIRQYLCAHVLMRACA